MRGACLIVLLCSGVVAGSPKSLTGQALALEVRGGVTRSHVASDYAASGPRRGGEVGVGVDLTLRSWLGVRAEVGYAEAGALGPGPFQLRMGYLTVPIAVRLSAPTPRLGLQPYVTAGVTPAREVQCRGRTVPATIVSVAAPPTVALNCQDLRTERFEVRGTVGLGA